MRAGRKSAFRNQRSFRRLPHSFGAKPQTEEKGWFNSLKLDRTLHYWHWSERDFMTLLEADPKVESYEVRPKGIEILDGGEVYQPSFIVTSQCGMTAVELVKAGEPSAAHERAVELVSSYYASRGIRFACIPRPTLRAEPRLSNARMIMGSDIVHPSQADVIQVHDLLSPAPIKLADIEAAFGDRPYPRELVLALARIGAVIPDLRRFIDGDTVFVSS